MLNKTILQDVNRADSFEVVTIKRIERRKLVYTMTWKTNLIEKKSCSVVTITRNKICKTSEQASVKVIFQAICIETKKRCRS